MDYKNLVQSCCDFYQKCIGIPYDFDGCLSLEAKFIKLFQVCQQMFKQNADLAAAFGDLSEKVDNFLSDLGVQGMVENIVKEMVADGSLDDIISDEILAPIKEQLASHDQRIGELEGTVSGLSGLPDRMTQCEEKSQTAVDTANTAKTVAEEAKQKVDAIPDDIGQVGEQLTEFESRISTVEQSNSQTVQTVQSYDSRISSAQSAAGEASRAAGEAKAAAEAASEEAASASAAAATASGKADTATQTANTAKSSADSAVQTVGQYDSRLSEVEAQAAQAASDAATAKNKAESASQTASAAQSAVSALEGTVSGFSADIQAAKEKSETNATDITALKEKDTQIEQNVTTLTQDNTTNKQNITKLDTRVTELEEAGSGQASKNTAWWLNKKWLFIGDSWMEGFNDDVGSSSSGNLKQGWGAQAAQVLGFPITKMNNGSFWVKATGGYGFAAKSQGFATMLQEWADAHTSEYEGVTKDQIDYVVVGGGYNDGYYSSQQISSGISAFLGKVYTNMPQATVIIVPIAWANYGATKAYSNLYSTSQLRTMLNTYLTFGENDTNYATPYIVADTLWAIGRWAKIYDSYGMHPTYDGNAKIGYAFAQWVKGATGFNYAEPRAFPETPKITFNSTWSSSEIALSASVCGTDLLVGVPADGECILRCASQELYLYYDSEFEVGTVKSCAVNGDKNGIMWTVPATIKSAGDDGGSFFDVHCMVSIREGKLYCKPIAMNDSRNDYLRLNHVTEITFYCKLPFQTVPLYTQ